MNRLGSIQEGKPIYPMFASETHIAKEEIPVAATSPLYVGLDFGLTPAATLVKGSGSMASTVRDCSF